MSKEDITQLNSMEVGFSRSPTLKYVAKCIGALAASVTLSSQVSTGDPLTQPGLAVGYFTDRGCQDPRAEDKVRVYDNMRTARQINISDIPGASLNELADREAERAGLTLVDEEPYLERVDQSETVSTTTEVLTDFMQNYGIEFSVLDKRRLIDTDNAQPLGETSMDHEDYRSGALTFIDNFHLMPTELIEEADIEGIEIVGETGLESAAGTYSAVTDGVDITYDTFVRTPDSTSTHETMHGIDKSTCGAWGLERDPSFRELNDNGWEYGLDEYDTITMSHVIDSHAAKNPQEDKAAIGERFLTGLDPYILSPEHAGPIVYRKAMLLLGRLEGRVPNISRYIAALNHISRALRLRNNIPK